MSVSRVLPRIEGDQILDPACSVIVCVTRCDCCDPELSFNAVGDGVAIVKAQVACGRRNYCSDDSAIVVQLPEA